MKKNSFTIIELIITMTVLAFMGWLGISALLSGTDSWLMLNQRKEIMTDGRMAMDRMAREIRMIKDKTSVLTADAAALSFVDIDNNTISFALNSSVLERTENSTANGLLDNVASLSFTYYDANNSVIAAPIVSPLETNIKIIQINISLSKGPSQVMYLQVKSWPRNLK